MKGWSLAVSFNWKKNSLKSEGIIFSHDRQVKGLFAVDLPSQVWEAELLQADSALFSENISDILRNIGS